jgi:FAD/FMN-containing dehydrogenase
MRSDALRLSTTARVTDATLRDLATSLGVAVLVPGDPEYAAQSGVFQLAAVNRPAAIVRPRDATGVARTIAFARERGFEIAVRGGGHSAAGHSTGDGVLVIDMRGLTRLDVDPVARRVRVGAGLPAGAVVTAAHEHGLTVPFGDNAAVGVAGLTLGGGVGYLSRQHGLTADHLVSAQVVTADGRTVRASAAAEPDLFWALRGGGGNFGVVTELEFDLVEAGVVYGGALLLPPTADVLRAVVPLAGAAPRELGIIATAMPAPPAPFVPPDMVRRPIVAVVGIYNGDAVAGAAAWAPFRALAKPVADVVGPMPYPAIYQFTEAAARPAVSTNRSVFVDVVDDSVVDVVREAYLGSPAATTLIQVRVLGGAVGDQPVDSTAYAHRGAPVHLMALAIAATPDDIGPCRGWAEDVLARLRGRAVGAYANFLEDEGEARVREAYPLSSYRRLAAVKATWDPDNVFRRNQNIRPAV